MRFMEANGENLLRWPGSPGRVGRIRPALYRSNTDHKAQRNSGRPDRAPWAQPAPVGGTQGALQGRRVPFLYRSVGTRRLKKPLLVTPRICVGFGYCRVLLKYIYVPLGFSGSPLKRFTQRNGAAAALYCSITHWGKKIEGAHYYG